MQLTSMKSSLITCSSQLPGNCERSRAPQKFSSHTHHPHSLIKRQHHAHLKGFLCTRRPITSTPPLALPEGALQGLVESALSSTPGIETGALINTLVYIFGIKVLLKGLTWEGVISSWFLGTLSYAAFGPGSYAIVCLYFLVGSLVTKIKLEQKQKEGIAEAKSGRRSLGSVLGSGIAGIVCALAAFYTGNFVIWRLGFIASFASKLADTVSSEIGKAYGKTTYLVTNFQRVPRGTEGAVSLEGTAAGVVAAAGVGIVGLLLKELTIHGVAYVTAAAFIANLLESYIGAAVQGKVSWLTNDVVNMLQITVAAALAIAFAIWFPK